MLISTSHSYTSHAFTPEETIQENKVKYDQLDNKILELNSKISDLDVEIEKLNTSLQENNNEIETTESEIKFTKNLLDQTQEEIDKSQVILDNRVRSMYKNNISSNMLLSILTSTSLFDMISKVQSISKIVSVDKAMIEDINEKKDTLNSSIVELNDKQEKLVSLKADTEKNIDDVESKKSIQTQYLDELNTEKDAIFSVIEENEKTLVQHPISVINSDSSSASELQNAVNTLNFLIPQLNSSYVISLAQDAIASGNSKIDALNTPVSPNTGNDTAIKTLTMESTAYTGGGLTAMGLKPVRDPNGISTVSVDPSVIPLGSKVYVSGYGVAIASDTGGAIKGNKIDVYLNSYEDCAAWGRRTVTVDILAYPGEW